MVEMEGIEDGSGNADVHMGNTNSSSSSTGKQQNNSIKGHEITSKTIRTPPFSYVHMELITSSATQADLDDLTMRSYITAALTQFLGLTGSAISVDLLKVEGQECWIRIPREDLSPVVAALGGWVGGNGNRTGGNEREQVTWRIRSSGNWLSVLVSNKDTEKIWNA